MLYASRRTLMPTLRQRIFLASAVGAAVIAAFTLRHESQKDHDQKGSTTAAKAVLADDISRLNATVIQKAWDVPSEESTAQSALRELLKHAGSSGMHVSIAGARHSMGGQTIAPGGVRVNILPLKSMALHERTNLLHVDAGALWADVIPYLDSHGRSIEVMQSTTPSRLAALSASTAMDGSTVVHPLHRRSSHST
jgi:FAD/FMN-containing dehydrogenase